MLGLLEKLYPDASTGPNQKYRKKQYKKMVRYNLKGRIKRQRNSLIFTDRNI